MNEPQSDSFDALLSLYSEDDVDQYPLLWAYTDDFYDVVGSVALASLFSFGLAQLARAASDTLAAITGRRLPDSIAEHQRGDGSRVG